MQKVEQGMEQLPRAKSKHEQSGAAGRQDFPVHPSTSSGRTEKSLAGEIETLLAAKFKS
jgi:hypothetical protein